MRTTSTFPTTEDMDVESDRELGKIGVQTVFLLKDNETFLMDLIT